MAGRTMLRRQRDPRHAGHATTEALMMIPALMLLWMCVLYAGAGYRKAMSESTLIRRAAWANAMSGCEAGGINDTELHPSSRSLGGPVGRVVGMLDPLLTSIPFLGETYPGLSVDNVGYAREATVRAPEALAEGGEVTIGRHHQLFCDESPEDLNLLLLSQAAWTLFAEDRW